MLRSLWREHSIQRARTRRQPLVETQSRRSGPDPPHRAPTSVLTVSRASDSFEASSYRASKQFFFFIWEHLVQIGMNL